MKTFRRLLSGLLVAVAVLFHVVPARAAGREVREVAAFTEISLANSATVIVTQGSPQKVEVEGSPEDLSRLETTVSNSKLRIGTTPGLKNPTFGKITVYITVPTINSLTVNGSGTLRAGSIQASKLQLAVSGSGRLEVSTLQATELHSSVSGSGTISAAGTSPTHFVDINGSGSVKANDLRSESGKVSISGSGNCHLNVTGSLDASLRGSGNVVVTGNPTINSKTLGSGRVRRG
ncbi:head GIN domain-containing protein [Hymenobacter cellulosivorans]|uniref:DUF2807 domain-containing protein n=1 Tax=Hymenobacter cellulosivorans TaxID=2932249 RepID=A0ABY4FDC0_9BACT|nr:head GIN domain-containing protein [Hymenobacter cellulosivorans]UOQ54395.1 DUF2807 domain-containing protein [Hymenobacter cellulosivorans]